MAGSGSSSILRLNMTWSTPTASSGKKMSSDTQLAVQPPTFIRATPSTSDKIKQQTNHLHETHVFYLFPDLSPAHGLAQLVCLRIDIPRSIRAVGRQALRAIRLCRQR